MCVISFVNPKHWIKNTEWWQTEGMKPHLANDFWVYQLLLSGPDGTIKETTDLPLILKNRLDPSSTTKTKKGFAVKIRNVYRPQTCNKYKWERKKKSINKNSHEEKLDFV